MIVCYAQGGGLGHLTRIRAFLHTVHPGRPATIISGSEYTADPRVAGPHPVRYPPAGLDAAELSRWIGDTLHDLRPDEFVVDAFPAGLHGELTAAVVPAATRTVTHLARLLRFDAYRPVLPARPLRYDRTWQVEPLGAEHRAYLDSVSASTAALTLVEPPVEADPEAARVADGAWLVVHSGPAHEVTELLGYAAETADLEGVRPRIVLVSPHRNAADHPCRLDAYPAWPLFDRADRVITAAGCNTVRQTAACGDRHRMLPFPRRFDDQFARAARSRRPGDRG